MTHGWNETSPLPPTLSQFSCIKFHKFQQAPCLSLSAIKHATETRLPMMKMDAVGCLSVLSVAAVPVQEAGGWPALLGVTWQGACFQRRKRISHFHMSKEATSPACEQNPCLLQLLLLLWRKMSLVHLLGCRWSFSWDGLCSNAHRYPGHHLDSYSEHQFRGPTLDFQNWKLQMWDPEICLSSLSRQWEFEDPWTKALLWIWQ